MDAIEEQNRMKAARLVAEWEIGDRSWADRIIWAYLNPAAAIADIHEQQKDENRTSVMRGRCSVRHGASLAPS